MVDCFSIRSFGSWGEARYALAPTRLDLMVSVSALSDRGVRLLGSGRWSQGRGEFQYPLFRIVG